MKGERVTRTSSDYQRDYRERMRQSGLVKKDVWIRPEHAAELAAVERRLREPGAEPGVTLADVVPALARWTIHSLHAALRDTAPVRNGVIELEWMEGAEPTLHLVMREHGDLPVFVAVGGEQVLVEALMWPVAQVGDTAAFNAHLLRTHKLLPLSTMGIEMVGGEPWYLMIGALDTQSSIANVLFEIEMLAENALAAAEAYRPFLIEGAAA